MARNGVLLLILVIIRVTSFYQSYDKIVSIGAIVDSCTHPVKGKP